MEEKHEIKLTFFNISTNVNIFIIINLIEIGIEYNVKSIFMAISYWPLASPKMLPTLWMEADIKNTNNLCPNTSASSNLFLPMYLYMYKIEDSVFKKMYI